MKKRLKSNLVSCRGKIISFFFFLRKNDDWKLDFVLRLSALGELRSLPVQLHLSSLNNRKHRTAPGAGGPGASTRKTRKTQQQPPAPPSTALPGGRGGSEALLSPPTPGISSGFSWHSFPREAANHGGPRSRSHGWVRQLSAAKKFTFPIFLLWLETRRGLCPQV